MKMPRGVRARAALATSVLAVAALAACVPSPKTTYETDAGETITVDWAGYPGHARIDAETVLAAPSAEEVKSYAAEFLGSIEEKLTAEFGLRWEDDPSWPQLVTPWDENGYGGGSLYVGVESGMRQSTSVPDRAEDWYRVIDMISAVAKEYGLGEVEIDNFDPSSPEEFAESFGTADPDEQWQWQGGAEGEHDGLYVAITDVRRDPTGDAAKMSRRGVMKPQFIAISYRATALPDAERQAFIERLRPFKGLEHPDATHSD
ncbi:hypothetical protein [Salinibacterium sp. ZJ450]|uniref:hypothetical protein n=1 Tax=Salinibacterium sp. ZJ450 TaxID=2708338 RepID=UPI00141FE4D9|nr:hypothetical protein [Salinibacterium sp. ZJ450]